MEDVLDVYLRPYNPLFPVICMDEQPVQLVKETRTPIPAEQGGFIQVEKNENTFYRVNISIGKYEFNRAVETNRGLPSRSREKT